MKVVVPYTMTDAILSSSTVAEMDHAAWNSATAYNVGDKVIRTSTHRIYEAVGGSTNKTPETEPDYWLDLGATNRWKMFDNKVGTKTTATTSMTIELEPDRFVSAVALLELSASSVTVTVEHPVDGEIYSSTEELTAPISVSDWWYYFFEPQVPKTTAYFMDVPGSVGSTISVTVTGATGTTVECGVLLVGDVIVFADAVRYGARVGIVDYSRKTVDDWGNTEIVERSWSKSGNWTFMLQRNMVDLFQFTLAGLRARPALYIGSDIYEATTIYGFFKNFEILIEYPTFSQCSIELEGLI